MPFKNLSSPTKNANAMPDPAPMKNALGDNKPEVNEERSDKVPDHPRTIPWPAAKPLEGPMPMRLKK